VPPAKYPKTLSDALNGLAYLLSKEFERFDVTSEAQSAIAAAPEAKKRDVLLGYLQIWTGRLSEWLNDAFDQYVQIAVANRRSTGEPVEWAEAQIRTFLPDRVGARWEPASQSMSGDEDFVTWVTAGRPPHKNFVAWVAAVTLNEGNRMGHTNYETGEWEVIQELADQWRAPAWVKSGRQPQHVDDRLGEVPTRREIAFLQLILWEHLDEAILVARLKATVKRGQSSEAANVKLRKSRNLTKREFVIRKAIDAGRHGIEYCKYLDGEGLKTPASWDEKNRCPDSYVKAYKNPAFRRLI
jgi:hypothetical protein